MHGSPAPPDLPEDDFGSSLAMDFDLGPSESTVVHIVLAWYAPLWKGEGDHCFTPMYATRYSDSLEVARLLARDHDVILKRILNWQQAIYTDDALPVWLREALMNNLHLITEVSLWAAAKPPIGDWCRPEDGLYGMNESPRECPQMECIPCSFYGNIPVVYFFPELASQLFVGIRHTSIQMELHRGSLAVGQDIHERRAAKWPCRIAVIRQRRTASPMPTWSTNIGCEPGMRIS